MVPFGMKFFTARRHLSKLPRQQIVMAPDDNGNDKSFCRKKEKNLYSYTLIYVLIVGFVYLNYILLQVCLFKGCKMTKGLWLKPHKLSLCHNQR